MSYRKELPNNFTEENGYIISPPDRTLIIVTIFLVVIGIMAIFSAGAPKCIMQGTHSTFFVLRQFIWFILGCIAMFFLSHVNYKILNRLSLPFAWIIILLLIGVHFWGVTVNGAQRWLAIGPIQFQPSEAAKLAVIMLLASAFSKDVNLLNTKL